MELTRKIIKGVYERLGSWRAAGVALGLAPNTVRLIVLGETKFSPDAIEAATGTRYITSIAAWEGDQDNAPPYVLLSYPPRRCPVTGDWFAPGAHNQVYAPHVTQAQKRAYQRAMKEQRDNDQQTKLRMGD